MVLCCRFGSSEMGRPSPPYEVQDKTYIWYISVVYHNCTVHERREKRKRTCRKKATGEDRAGHRPCNAVANYTSFPRRWLGIPSVKTVAGMVNGMRQI